MSAQHVNLPHCFVCGARRHYKGFGRKSRRSNHPGVFGSEAGVKGARGRPPATGLERIARHHHARALQRFFRNAHRWTGRPPAAVRPPPREMKPLDDRRFQIRLKRPFRQMLYALGAQQCFMMPERMARTSPSEQIKEYVGSGPYRFLTDEWVSGAKAVWAKFDKYPPRQEKPSYFSGGKMVNVDRVEWIVQPDPATSAAALQTGEFDWVELPLIDLVPMLKAADAVQVKVFDPFGWLGVLAFNHLYPPLDNPMLLRAILSAVDQKSYVQSIVGEQTDLGRYPVGFFSDGSPMANKVGLELVLAPHDIAKSRKLVAEFGYNGERILLMSPTDQPALAQITQVTRSLFQDLGLNVEFMAMDWGSLVSRRANTPNLSPTH